jgi:two-component system, NtrC family, sensor kinase
VVPLKHVIGQDRTVASLPRVSTIAAGCLSGFALGFAACRLYIGSREAPAAGNARLLAAATEQTADLILITRADGSVEHANAAFLRALGYSREELATRRFGDLLERGFERVGDHIASEVRARGSWRGTLLRRRRDGSIFPAASSVVGLKQDSETITHFVAVERDTTEELKLRDQLVHSERLSAVGQLITGVAHELNNPLQTIVGCTELLLEEHRDASLRADLEMVAREAARAGQIVRNLLSFVRRGTTDRSPADVNDIVRTTTELRRYALEQRAITLSLELAPEPLPALVNREQVQQVLLNLLMNAEHATHSRADAGQITIRTSSAGERHTVDVADNGPGIRPELRGRIFEPFFTTKDVGQGTGLGLSISHGIASAHGGSLELVPTRTGACFRLTLPAHIDRARSAPAAAGREMATRRALVIDDKESIRTLLARLLVRRGFDVVQAESGDAALAAGPPGGFSIVLCDVNMPGLGGLDVLERFAGQDPSIARRFVFITGDVSLVESHTLVLPKPFTATDLEAVLTRVEPRISAERT